MPTWARDYLDTPIDFLNNIFALDECNKESGVDQEAIEEIMSACCIELDNIALCLKRLGRIEQIIDPDNYRLEDLNVALLKLTSHDQAV